MLGKRETMAKDGRSAMCAPYGLVIGFCVRQQDIVDFEEALWDIVNFYIKKRASTKKLHVLLVTEHS
jgi:hypothetical protein